MPTACMAAVTTMHTHTLAPNEIPSASSPTFYTLKFDGYFCVWVCHISFIVLCIGTSKYQMPSALSPRTVLTHSHQIFVSVFNSVIVIALLACHEHSKIAYCNRYVAIHSIKYRAPSFSFRLRSCSRFNLFVNVVAFNLFASFHEDFFYRDEHMVVPPSYEYRQWSDELRLLSFKKNVHIIYILGARPDADPYDTKANEVYAINW